MITYYAVVTPQNRVIARDLSLDEAEKTAEKYAHVKAVVIKQDPPIKQRSAIQRYRDEERERRSNSASTTPGSRFD